MSLITILAAATVVYLALRFVLFRKLLGEPAQRLIRFKTAWQFAGSMLLGAAIAVALLALTLLPGILRGFITIQPGGPDPASAAVQGNLYTMLAVMALYEELVFRGMLMLVIAIVPAYLISALVSPAAVRTRNFQLFLLFNAAAISSLVFSFVHGNNPSVNSIALVNIFLVGVMLALLFLRTRGLAAPFAFHFAWNGLLEVVNLPVSGMVFSTRWHPFTLAAQGPALLSGGAFGPEASLSLTLLLAAACLLLARMVMRDRGQLGGKHVLSDEGIVETTTDAEAGADKAE